jgi:enamine deaminase RidA (YjgF/YER057c/UK114 family)
MSQRQRVSSGSPFESQIGFSRAVRQGPFISVSGTAPIAEGGGTDGIDDPARQTRRCLEIIQDALARLGVPLEAVIRTRIFIVRLEDWEAIASVHGEFFGEIRPASTVVQVQGLLDPDWRVEIEADAVEGL